MASKFTVGLDKIIEAFKLETIHLPKDASEIQIDETDVTRPGLQLMGFYEYFNPERIQIIGKMEFAYLSTIDETTRQQRLEALFSQRMPALVISRELPYFEEMLELAKKYGVQLVVRSSLNRAEGTVVKEETEMEGMLVSGVAVDKNAARIAIIGIKDEPGMAFKIFDLLAKKNINVDIILQSIGRDGTKDISFTVSRDQMDEAVKVLKDNAARVKAQKIEADPTVAKLSIVGAGMQTHPGVAAGMFEALYNVGVNIRMIGTSEIRVTVLVDEKDVDKAMRAAHDKFIED